MRNFVLLLGLLVLFFGCTSNTNTQQTDNGQVQVNQAPIQPAPIDEETTMNPNPVKEGDLVAADYIGALDDGTVFDTSIKEEALKAGLAKQSYQPLQVLIGQGMLIEGFENALIGMKEGEDKTVHLTPDEAYGEPTDELIVTVNKTELPEDMQGTKINVGGKIEASGRTGTVTATTSSTITVDFNHPLAGKNLTFTIFLRKILN